MFKIILSIFWIAINNCFRRMKYQAHLYHQHPNNCILFWEGWKLTEVSVCVALFVQLVKHLSYVLEAQKKTHLYNMYKKTLKAIRQKPTTNKVKERNVQTPYSSSYLHDKIMTNQKNMIKCTRKTVQKNIVS